MRIFFLLIVFFTISALINPVARANAPLSPNFCLGRLCVQIEKLSDVKIESSSTKNESTIIIQSEQGSTKIQYEVRSCQPKPIIYMKENNSYLKGNGCLSLGESIVVDIFFKPKNIALDSRQQMPVAAIWIVDDYPKMFWEKGYALRLGPQTTIQ